MSSLSGSIGTVKTDKESALDSRDKAKAMRQRIDDTLDTLAKAVDDVRASDTFKAYLDTQARFHRYSWHNSFLIVMQRPDATRVAGFQTWKKLGRFVRKGERGIMIFAPCPFHREVERDGNVEAVDGVFFRPVHVFDIGQTDGADLPTVEVPTIASAADSLLAALGKVALSRGITVSFQAISGGAFGLSKGGAIEIDNRHSTGQQAKTLAHEIAHEALHWDKDSRPSGLTREVAELEAESVAYVVCTHFGLDCTVRSSAYIAVWDGDSKALRASLERIAKTARDIIDQAEADESVNVSDSLAIAA